MPGGHVLGPWDEPYPLLLGAPGEPMRRLEGIPPALPGLLLLTVLAMRAWRGWMMWEGTSSNSAKKNNLLRT
eukprot:1136647-Pelagomonas_calceolata.AAC.6